MGVPKIYSRQSKPRARKKWALATWYHLGSNLYVVPVPKFGAEETPIERVFDDAYLKTIYKGKQFNDTNADKDSSKFYDKKVFATKIVAANKAT